ncbi:MAG: aminotransferase class I/II-fold pyridoxal phosphate-dependent enzyme [Chitinophagaceae bacterium]
MFLDGLFGRNAFIDGKEYLFFSGYDYLSVHIVSEFYRLVQEGIQKYGWVYPSSRISNTQISLYEDCEARLSEITNTEETVLFGSGFNAGQSCIALFGNDIDNAPLSHPAILQQKSLLYDFDNWKDGLINDNNDHPIILASDAVNNFSLLKYDFDSFTALNRKATFIIDDSHGIGVTGATGGGAAEYIPRNPNIDYLFTYSMGKAFGIEAGAVSTNKYFANQLRSLPSFTAVTPPSPGPLYAFLHGKDIYAQQLEKLRNNIQYMAELLKDIPNIKIHPELPIVLLPSNTNEQNFFNNGFIISSFAYPDPNGEKLNRLVLTAAHTKVDLEKVAAFVRSDSDECE